MKIDLTGKTAIVSGSTAGIGLAIAEAQCRSRCHRDRPDPFAGGQRHQRHSGPGARCQH